MKRSFIALAAALACAGAAQAQSSVQLTGLVENVIFKGVHYEMHVRQAGYEWIIHSTQASQVGELIGMNIGPDEIHIMHRTQG